RGVQERVARIRELDAHQQRKHARAEEEEKSGCDIEDADIGVVDLAQQAETPWAGPNRLQALEAVRAAGVWLRCRSELALAPRRGAARTRVDRDAHRRDSR